MKNKLKNKVAIITGASSGIGLAIAKLLFKNGVKIYNISRATFEADEIIKSYECDVNNTEKIKEIVENASKENIYKLVDTNLSAVIALSSLIIPYLKESKGNIINISSVGAVIPLPFQATYSATKAGVEIFSRALANEVKPFKIKVTAILPGDTKTGFTQNRIVENTEENKDYQKIVENSIKKVEKDEQTGKSPDSVAKVVVKILKRKNPPLRKTVGFAYKLVVFLPRILPTKLVNFIVRKLYC